MEGAGGGPWWGPGATLKGFVHLMLKNYPIFGHFGASKNGLHNNKKALTHTYIIYPYNFLNRF